MAATEKKETKNTFHGGVHPPDSKEYARESQYTECPAGSELIFPLNQHIGKLARPVVKKNDHVLRGQLLAQADGFISANIASSCSGIVKALEGRPNAMGIITPSIVIENDNEYTLAEGIGEKNSLSHLSRGDILEHIKAAGIVGMGGAGFPTHIKLSPKNPENIQYILANGAECEPYITCDDQLMRRYAREIIAGLEIILFLFPRAEGVIVIEENKPEAISTMQTLCDGNKRIRVMPVQTKYPQGGERSLISVVTGRHLKSGMLPADVGCIVDNVSTIRAVYRAVRYSEPLMERGFTVSGDCIKRPCNFFVKIGTPFSMVLSAAGGFSEPPKKILCGGPMMGISMPNLDAGVCKNNNALIVLREDPVEQAQEKMTTCLRCGRCNQVCPIGLVPQMMSVAAERQDYVRYEKKLYGLECIACGSCTYICPAKRPLMQIFRQAKAEIMERKQREGRK